MYELKVKENKVSKVTLGHCQSLRHKSWERTRHEGQAWPVLCCREGLEW